MTTNRTVSFSLFDLPEDARAKEIYPHCSLKELCLFAQTSRKYEEETAFLRLLSSAVNATPESHQQTDETKLAALAILKRHPSLLFRKGLVTDHFDRKIFSSPYQLFLGAGDTWALQQAHEDIIPHIYNGEAQAQAQFQEQFPYSPWPFDPNLGEEQLYDDRNKAQVTEVIDQLEVIIKEITADPCTNGLATLNETTNAVTKLRQIVAPKKGDLIQTGLHFPSGIMREICKIHEAQFDTWNGDQLAFFSRKVIGAAEAASTAVNGQCYKYGISNLNMKKGPDRRDGLFCSQPRGLPLTLAPINNKLGRTMFVDFYDGTLCFLSQNEGYFDWFNKNGRGLEGPHRRVAALRAGATQKWTAYENQKLEQMAAIMHPDIYAPTQGRYEHEQPWQCVMF